MTWRILWGNDLEYKINDLEGVSFGQACINHPEKFQEHLGDWETNQDPGRALLTAIVAVKAPFIILSRVDGNSWEEQESGGNGSDLYWNSLWSSIMEATNE